MNLPSCHVGVPLGNLGAKLHMAAFIDPVCPFSNKGYHTVREVVSKLGDSVSCRFVLWIQPWHGQTASIAKVLFATLLLNKDKFFPLLDAIYEKQDLFSDAKTGDLSANQILEMAANLAHEVTGLHKEEIIQMAHSKDVLHEFAFYTRYGRQNGVHWSPSFTVNGLTVPGADSTWTVEQWLRVLGPVLHAREQQEQRYTSLGEFSDRP